MSEQQHARAKGTRSVAAPSRGGRPGQLSVLAVAPGADRAAALHLLQLGEGLRGHGDHYRVVALGTMPPDNAPGQCTTADASWPGAATRFKPAGLVAYSRAILRALLTDPTDVVYCTSIGMSYAAMLAIFAHDFCRPLRPEPALVTSLLGDEQRTLGAAAVRRLRYLSDAVIVGSGPARELVLRHGFPAERISVIPPTGAVVSSTRTVYLEACARSARRAEPAFSYET